MAGSLARVRLGQADVFCRLGVLMKWMILSAAVLFALAISAAPAFAGSCCEGKGKTATTQPAPAKA